MRTRPLALVATSALALALTACGTTSTDMADPTASPASATAEASTANAADVMFAQGMVPHHEQAIEMSDIILGKEGIMREVSALAKQIKDAQQPEIDTLEEWIDDWTNQHNDAGHMMDDDTMGGMNGRMSTAQLEELRDADGPAASRIFLEQMIIHHEGAIHMSRAHLAQGEHPGARDMSQSIIESQQAEIDIMRELLDQIRE
ncbi:DUF305 domain-containing protein [Hoyosella sp. G463]|uniref:DUF305 domain-containing protein n=1 Tax=Lolliginicoccus lacisalsi TaxID=2742202 RepID=A0A927J9C2_9ACTN|nr:DUF305 domain-containing protein [Lolliginicoccus lacisalsi]MBD8504901.1 DUF305 domain-containing protein [Lolliginicoccus lacisalsi]